MLSCGLPNDLGSMRYTITLVHRLRIQLAAWGAARQSVRAEYRCWSRTVMHASSDAMQYAVACEACAGKACAGKACREIFKSMIRRKTTMRALTIVAALMLGLTSMLGL